MQLIHRICVLGVAALVVQACAQPDHNGSEQGVTEAAVCAPVTTANLAADVSVESFAGEFALHLASGEGDDARSVDGRLTLSPSTGEYTLPPLPDGREVPAGLTSPLYGTVDIDLAAVGASYAGRLDSSDENAPSVLLLETRPDTDAAPSSILIRIGSQANSRTIGQIIDGAFMVLDVKEVDGERFVGLWRSGAGVGEAGRTARGYFCATRVR